MLTLDVEMPGLNGIEFLKQLLPKNPIPVILVSSLNLSVFDALSAGAVDFVRKTDILPVWVPRPLAKAAVFRYNKGTILYAGRKFIMTYPEVLAAARECVGPYCKACPVCSGLACKNTVPGPGAKGL